MDIAIIGGGFYGCYLAKHLGKNNKVYLYEKNSKLIQESGRNNQYRLHLGFHYPRSPETIEQTIEGYNHFRKEFKKFIYFPKKNYYLIHKKSLISFNKYCKIFKKKKIFFKKVSLKKIPYLKSLDQYSGAIETNEGVILIDKLIKNLTKTIKKNVNLFLNTEIKKIDSENGLVYFRENNHKKFDYIINTTYLNPNLGLSKKKFQSKYEGTAMLIPKTKIPNLPGITIMDGNFVSLYPRSKNEFSISSVKYTPVYKFNSYKNIERFKNLLKIKKNEIKIKKNIFKHFSKFINLKFELKKSKLETSFKIKLKKDTNSLRTTDLIIEKKLISVFCGKLDTVPLILNKLKKKLTIN
tara:strand:+ start:965 stop:2020 length:1056 start_codon:yes stop_codon:yes gene_type:complete